MKANQVRPLSLTTQKESSSASFFKSKGLSSFINNLASPNSMPEIEKALYLSSNGLKQKKIVNILGRLLKKYGLYLTQTNSDFFEIHHNQFSIGVDIAFAYKALMALVTLHPDMTIGEGFMQRKWWVERGNLESAIKVFYEIMEDKTRFQLLTWVKRFRFFITQRNNPHKSKKNVSKHYDKWNKNNDFFSAMLGNSMCYSSAIYNLNSLDSGLDYLEVAQKRKLNLIINLMEVKPGERVLDIGSGWGALTKALSLRFIKVTGLTLSKEQYKWCVSKLLKDEKYLLQDYRIHKTPLPYDHISCLEVLDHIGSFHYNDFFQTMSRLLKPSGSLTMQLILRPKKGITTKWIDKYIYPGGYIASFPEVERAFSKTGFYLLEKIDYEGEHYAKTLEDWRENIIANWDSLAKKHRYTQQDLRMWLFYFASSISVFRNAGFFTSQIKLCKREVT